MKSGTADGGVRPDLFSFISEGKRCVVKGRGAQLFNAVALLLIVYSTWYALFGTTNQHMNTAIFAGVLLPIVFVTTTRNRRTDRIGLSDYLLAALSVAVFGYFILNDDFYGNLMQGLTLIPWYEIMAGLLAIALTAEACRRSLGWGLTTVLLTLLAYAAFGHHLPGTIGHPPIEMPYFITIQTVTTEGLFGSALEMAATYAILFITYGTFFERTGGGDMFFELAAALVGKSKGGGSKACVISSGLYGSISGSPVADVVTTGPITIPLMKKMGVSAARAAGIEAASSTGGAMLPPVMGAVAFIMVGYTGISYLTIAIAATLPSILYYFGVMYGVHLDSQRINEGELTLSKRYSVTGTLLRYWRHCVSMTVMCILLMLEFSAAYVAAASVLTLIVTSWTSGQREERIGLHKLLECSGETIRMIAALTAAVMAAGVIIGCIMLTGLTGKFSIIISTAGGGYLAGVLIASAVVLVILGMGMPTVSVYMIGVALIAPILIVTFKLGVLETHMFILFFACLSAITPPLAVACFASASIADADPMATGIYACKIGYAGFLLPFFFITHPGALLEGDAMKIVLEVCVGSVMVFAGAWALFGRSMDTNLNWPIRIAAGILVAMMLSRSVTLNLVGVAGTFALAAFIYVNSRAAKRKLLLHEPAP